VLLLLIATAGAAYLGMVRQNASLENLVQVRARLKSAADVSGEARYAHAHIYQLLAWVNGSFAQAGSMRWARRSKPPRAIEQQLRKLDALADDGRAPIVEQSLQALAAYRKAVLETMDMAQMDQSIATNAMARAEQQFLLLNDQLARCRRWKSAQRAGARAGQGRLQHAQHRHGRAGAAVDRAVAGRDHGRAQRHAARYPRDRRRGVALAAGRLRRPPQHGRDEIADTARMLDQTMAKLTQRWAHPRAPSIDTAAREIASGNLDLSSRTEMQASSLEQTASAMNSLTRPCRPTPPTRARPASWRPTPAPWPSTAARRCRTRCRPWPRSAPARARSSTSSPSSTASRSRPTSWR
jgi:methyl-accepting chemotaxis protein